MTAEKMRHWERSLDRTNTPQEDADVAHLLKKYRERLATTGETDPSALRVVESEKTYIVSKNTDTVDLKFISEQEIWGGAELALFREILLRHANGPAIQTVRIGIEGLKMPMHGFFSVIAECASTGKAVTLYGVSERVRGMAGFDFLLKMDSFHCIPSASASEQAKTAVATDEQSDNDHSEEEESENE